MPRKRRQPKRRRMLPDALDQVSRCERALWSARGPLIAPDGDEVTGPYHIWPNVHAWRRFYGGVREQLFAGREWLRARSVAEAMFHGIAPPLVREDPRRWVDAT